MIIALLSEFARAESETMGMRVRSAKLAQRAQGLWLSGKPPSGGPTSGKSFPGSVKQQALDENPSTCVYCRMKTDRPQVDHSIPKSCGGNATIDNAQTTCTHCNASKGARDFPVTPPGGYEGPWPPPWWR